MRLNTRKSMKLARRVKRRYGTWQAVREASRVQNGVFIVEAQPKQQEPEQADRHPVTA